MSSGPIAPPITARNAYQGAQQNRLLGNSWRLYEADPNDDWASDATILAQRAAELVRNDPVMAALLSAKITGTHGAIGLRMRSLYEEDAVEGTTDTEIAMRREIEQVIADGSFGTQLDANGLCTRHEFEEGLDELASIAGEAFAVRCFIPGRNGATGATCWRLIRMERVCNPWGKSDSETLFQGFELDANGQVAGIYIAPPRRIGLVPKPDDWQFVPWYADDGALNVIHRIGRRVPGSYRGISMFAPNIMLAKQVKGTIDAYVVAKRVQACHPIFIEADDPVAAAKADRNGAVWGPNTTLEPGKVYYVGKGNKVNFPSWQFQGADMREFLDTLYRNQFAAWGMPVDVVLAQLGRTNMAASRSAWQQYYRQCARWQDDHIEQVSRPLDEAIVREAIVRGDLRVPAAVPWRRVMASRYIRPPQSMPDPLKEAQAVAAWMALGRDLTGLFAESGVDFRESTVQRADDDAWRAEHGITVAPTQPGETARNLEDAAEPTDDGETGDDAGGSPGTDPEESAP